MKSLVSFYIATMLTLSLDAQMRKQRMFFDKYEMTSDSAHSEYFVWINVNQPRNLTKEQRAASLKAAIAKAVNAPEETSSETDTSYTYYTGSQKVRSRTLYRNHMRNGNFIIWYESGQIKEKGAYARGDKSGIFLKYYQTGTAQSVMQYQKSETGLKRQLNNYWDSSGVAVVTNGNGFCRCWIDADHETLKQVGSVRNGSKDSVWLSFRNDTLRYKELYNDGDLVDGVFYENDKKYEYKRLTTLPEYRGGLATMLRYLQRTVQYPEAEKRKGVQGKVFIRAMVEPSGELTNVQVIKGVSEMLNDAALSAVRKMPTWLPATDHGKPIRQSTVIPITFML